VFAQVVLADEVNRATPKAQSALLEAMEECQVTTDGEDLPAARPPFFVIATQNPTYQIGTFPLPESQLDRFLLRIVARASAGSAMNYNLSLGHALVFLLAGLGVVTILHTFRNLALMQISPGRCDPVFAGSTAQFALVMEQSSWRRDAPVLARISVDRRQSDRRSTSAAHWPARSLLLPVAADQRGWLQVPRITIETTWPLGLVQGLELCRSGTDLPGLSGTRRKSTATAVEQRHRARQCPATGRGADDFSGMRDHQAADSPRHIAWKSVARQHDGPLADQAVFWRCHGAAGVAGLGKPCPRAMRSSSSRLSILARWMLDADAAGHAWGLRIPGHPPGAGQWQRTHLTAGLRALALLPAWHALIVRSARRQAWWLLAGALAAFVATGPADSDSGCRWPPAAAFAWRAALTWRQWHLATEDGYWYCW
jgi:hypothetical protein